MQNMQKVRVRVQVRVIGSASVKVRVRISTQSGSKENKSVWATIGNRYGQRIGIGMGMVKFSGVYWMNHLTLGLYYS